MKNLTISLEDDLHRQSRVRAANAGVSMSRYVSSLIANDVRGEVPDSEEERKKRLDMLERFLSGPKLRISENGRMPNADERNARG